MHALSPHACMPPHGGGGCCTLQACVQLFLPHLQGSERALAEAVLRERVSQAGVEAREVAQHVAKAAKGQRALARARVAHLAAPPQPCTVRAVQRREMAPAGALPCAGCLQEVSGLGQAGGAGQAQRTCNMMSRKMMQRGSCCRQGRRAPKLRLGDTPRRMHA